MPETFEIILQKLHLQWLENYSKHVQSYWKLIYNFKVVYNFLLYCFIFSI